MLVAFHQNYRSYAAAEVMTGAVAPSLIRLRLVSLMLSYTTTYSTIDYQPG